MNGRLSTALNEVRWTASEIGSVLRYALDGSLSESIATDAGLMAAVEGHSKVAAWALASVGAVRWFVLALWCCAVDHRYRSEGYCGPDSGHEYVYCDRCGKTVADHWYY